MVRIVFLLLILGGIVVGIWLPVDVFMAYCALMMVAIVFPPPFVVKRLKGQLEGTVELTWNAIPPLRQRRLFALYVFVLTAFVLIAAWRGWFSLQAMAVLRPLTLMGLAAIVVVMPRIVPRRYTISDRGLWCTSAHPLGNPESERYTPQRYVYWEDLRSYAVQKDKIVLYLQSPCLRWLQWLPTGLRRIEIVLTGATSQRLPDITPELEENIVAHIRAHCHEIRDT